ncbi:fungal specific transcription factor [Pochonia chlamydosporia 170]|uniref:Fungal specific transcription factor n=1 Tax=Pochonia chlamydosporia 170 TaxID=1380566 RepID=A0A179FEQ6_METCM|nr:fungal specific transcription factor [Pochonia chlamydosporia 170]OAQ64075.1 fungal specific transcription factor [Pochonia chlamydosporia 170]
METDGKLSSRTACLACRRQKRKCSRQLPSCELCQRNRRLCEYSDDSLWVSSDAEALSSASTLAQSTQAQPSASLLFFLDSDEFTSRRSIVEPNVAAPPPELLKFAQHEGGRFLQYVEHYFQSTHTMLPIVSKRRFRQRMTETNPSSDTLTLAFCMHMVSQQTINVDMYDKAKGFLSMLERGGTISIQLLQATILAALYEISHAIYPAAFLTVGHCARLGQAIGLHDRRNSLQMWPVVQSWTELEELRRTWWAVIVLDRFVGLGIQNRPFACEDAKPEDMLPMDDQFWDQGEQKAIPSLAVSAETTLPASSFARTCQAAHLLSRVLAHTNSNASIADRSTYYGEGHQLHKVLTAFHGVVSHEFAAAQNAPELAPRLSALGICSSAMITLYSTHSCAELDDTRGVGIPEQLQLQQISLDGLHQVGSATCEFASRLASLLETNAAGAKIGIFATEAIYQVAKLYIWYTRETGKVEEYSPRIALLLKTLRLLGQKLQVASKIVSIYMLFISN